MEALAILIGLLIIGTLFVPWINLFRINGAEAEIRKLKSKIRRLEQSLSGAKVEKPAAAVSPVPTPTTPAPKPLEQKTVSKTDVEEFTDWETASVQKSTSTPPTPPSKPKESFTDQIPKFNFETNLATKLPVWIGAVSLICAAFFMVKYSMDMGLLSPGVRVTLGGLFGLVLIAAGQWLVARDHIANNLRMSQGLVGAGIVSLYASLYAATELYHILPGMLGFGYMAAVTVLAVVLSLRHGQTIAVFGLLGGLLTPALIGADDPNAIVMFTYLFVLFAGMFTVIARKGWWLLAIASVVGVFLWSGFWFMLVFAASDALVLVVFAIAITGVVLAVTGRMISEDAVSEDHKLPVHVLNFAAIIGGVLTIVWLSFEITLGLFDWSMLGLLSMALMGLSYFKPEIYQRPLWVKMGASLFLYFIWAQDVALLEAVLVLAGFAAIYIGGGALMMRRVSDPRFWAGMQVIAAGALFLIAYYVLDLPVWLESSFGMFWGIVSLVIASLAIYQASDIRTKYNADDTIREHLVAIYALAASAFISLGISIEMPLEYLPLAIAGQVAATAWVFQRTRIEFLKVVLFLLTVLFIGLNYDQLMLFVEIITESMDGHGLSKYSQVRSFVLDIPFLKLGLSAALMTLALSIYMRAEETIGQREKTLVHLLFGSVMGLGLMLLYYVVRMAFGDWQVVAVLEPAGFIERGVITFILAGIGAGIVKSQDRFDLEPLKIWGIGLFHLAMVRFVYFDFLTLLTNHGYAGSQDVGSWILLNGITMTYGLGALFATWAIYTPAVTFNNQGFKTVYKIAAFAALFAFVSLSVRQYFHPGIMNEGDVGLTELYMYSAAWLITGLGLLASGIKWESKTLRMTSLGFMILTVLKVFLFDAAELEGLYRVFSFLGLGLSLIGLSYFYTKFVFGGQIAEKANKA
ncbi:DUF2339 domain-containing protein [Alphaproteobacteria bacterium]|nr:DUF2339 domain-containing protein [Alphaproteobacteria bacterium]